MSKEFYKLELVYIKYSPMVTSLIILINSILSYFDIYISEPMGVLFGISIMQIGHMYISSKAYKFCKYHRMFIHYILVNNLLNIYDGYVGIPINDFSILMLYIIIAGIFAFLASYYHQKYGGRENE